MSRYVSNLYVAEFDRDVKKEYASTKSLRQTVRVKGSVVGESCRFQKMSQGMSTKVVKLADVVPMNVDFGSVLAIMEDWDAPAYTSVFDQKKINFDERAELVQISGAAIGRRETQLIIDAIATGATTLTVTKTIGSTTGMNTAKFREAKRLMDYYNVPETDRYFIMSSEALHDLLGDEDATTIDKNTIKMLVDGEIKKWLGFNIITFGLMKEGGLPKTGATRSAFAYHKTSTGYAIGMNMRTEINYIAEKVSWLVNTLYSAGAIAIDPYGMVTISHDEQE